MEQNNNKKGKTALIICLTIIILVLGTLLCLAVNGKLSYKDTNNTESKNAKKNNTTEVENVTTEVEKTAEEKIKNIEKKYLTILYPYTDLSDVSNQALMKAIITNSSFSHTFTKDQLEEKLHNSVFSRLTIQHEDFWFYGYNTDVAPNYSYDASTGIYTSNPVGRGACLVQPAYKKVINYEKNNNEYIIKYKYVWSYGCEGDHPSALYGKYNDAKNQQNFIFKIDASKYDYGTISGEAIANEVENNWETIESKLDTYTYTFIIEDNHYVLSDFERTES